MKEFWRSRSRVLLAFAVCYLYLLNLNSCWSLNDEGVASLRFKQKIVSDPHGALSNRIDEVSDVQQKEDLNRNSREKRYVAQRKLLQETRSRRRPGWRFRPPPEPPLRNLPTLPPPPPFFFTPAPAQAPTLAPAPEPLQRPAPPVTRVSPPSLSTPVERPNNAPVRRSRANNNRTLIYLAAIGGPVLLILLIVAILYYKKCMVVTVKPWASGLSGQLQRAFVTGVPKLKRSELEAACEDFSNVIGSSSVITIYKGTLSSGVEIAVASIAVASAKDWSKNQESHFRKKIATLSKVNHKNFVSLIGYCEEGEPFTRMLVFEYAPNGTLFEHLHIREAEHLDWLMRLRIAMGMAYCLDHMHQLSPALPHKNLTSQSICLTEDYAAKVSDFVLWEDEGAPQPTLESNVYSFGVVLFEIITGKLPYSSGSDDSVQDWASDYLKGAQQTLREIVDPTLRTYREDQLQMIGDVIKSCGERDPKKRPSMREVCVMLREITGIGPDGAIPKLSPLWWAEIEIMSNEAS